MEVEGWECLVAFMIFCELKLPVSILPWGAVDPQEGVCKDGEDMKMDDCTKAGSRDLQSKQARN